MSFRFTRASGHARRLVAAAGLVAAAILPVSMTAGRPAEAVTGPCTLGAKLVPSCGVLWGAAPAAFSSLSRITTLSNFETASQHRVDVYHGYHVNGQYFPTATERQITLDPSKPRLLLVNWRPGTDTTWAAIAAGKIDGRIDQAAKNMKSYPERFFLSVWHEGEHSVRNTAGSGMTAVDYRNMVRHVITRLRAKGVTNAVFVQIFQGYPAYAVQPWWPSMYPGDDVIDWIACDSYNSGNDSGYNSGGFDEMLNRVNKSWPGWYNWATTNHPTKPLMLAEWGVWKTSTPERMAWFYRDVKASLSKYPKLKALLYFNTSNHEKGTTAITSTTSGLSAYRDLVASTPTVDLSTR